MVLCSWELPFELQCHLSPPFQQSSQPVGLQKFVADLLAHLKCLVVCLCLVQALLVWQFGLWKSDLLGWFYENQIQVVLSKLSVCKLLG